MSTIRNRVVDNLHRLLRAKKMRPIDLCRATGIDPGNFCNLMARRRGCKIETLDKIIVALGVDPAELLVR